jgi:hypothetical protein
MSKLQNAAYVAWLTSDVWRHWMHIENINGRRRIINYCVCRRFGKVMRMNTTPRMNARGIWSRILVIVGSIAMLAGAVDPMEGSVVILAGSGLVALGAFLGQGERPLIAYRVWVFILILIGVGALWGLSNLGGIGGKSGRSMWWGVLILPYLIGWCMGIWGPGSPRWLLLLGIVVGLWYLVLCGMILKGPARHHGSMSVLPGIIIGTFGLVTIGGCISRLKKPVSAGQ